MDYNLDSLGSRNFEHLSQSLALKVLGPSVTVFGDGPDGGREATWEGLVPSLGAMTEWSGYGVLQAKFKTFTEDPDRNLSWMKSALKKELSAWADKAAKRSPKPDFLLFSTNVRLSPSPGNGKDELNQYIKELLSDLKLSVKDFRVWDYYDLLGLLDGAADVRLRYASFITSGDVIGALLEQIDVSVPFAQAISAYTARALSDESLLNLTQAGTAGDGQVTIGDVFVDLPVELAPQPWLRDLEVGSAASDEPTGEKDEDEDEDEDEDALIIWDDDDERTGIARHLIEDFNHIPEETGRKGAHPHRTVLIGGPGQGKSTVTQWLAQVYRVEFLRGNAVARAADVKAVSSRIDARIVALELPPITSRRWPFRIVLTELADYLAKSAGKSLLHFIAQKVSDRSSFEVDPLMLRRWLAGYPWLLLIDGLDEVPSSSNRAQVLTSIKDFFLDVSALGADVAAVATTRPQGYEEEFSPKEYRHVQLSTLNVDEALGYAQGLVDLRTGNGSTTAEKVMERLRRASGEEHTAKLFESPLQVTILEVLLEKLGKAPSDRSRLYSAYYNVISQREQEKSGALSELLQKYESDVHFLHRAIGYELQRRSAEVGDTSASLTTKEFNDFIVARFIDQGHSADEVESLSLDFSTLVTDRLVFLAKLQADRIGFELRSLQEFMAGEHVVNYPEHQVVSEIQKIALDPYWRNVVLFAVGSIFAHREHLRAEVLLLCDNLNNESAASEVLLPGSELAVDIIRDGSCLSMPKYSRSLARTALLLLSSPQGANVFALNPILNTDLSELVWQELESTVAPSNSAWMNRFRFLTRLWLGEGDRADVALHRIYQNADLALKRLLIEWTWRDSDRTGARIIGSEFVLCSADTFFGPSRGRRGRRSDSGPATWLQQLEALTSRSWAMANARTKNSAAKDSILSARWISLGDFVDEWKWLQGEIAGKGGWEELEKVAQFSIDPSIDRLVESLKGLSPEPAYLRFAPWPLAACVRYALAHSDFSEAIEELCDAALSGKLGTASDWLAAQDRWSFPLAVNEDFLSDFFEYTSLPLSPQLRESGVAIAGYTFTASGLHEADRIEEAVSLVKALVSRESSASTLIQVAMFIGSILVRDAKASDSDETLSKLGMRTILQDHASDYLGPYFWFGWLEAEQVTASEPDTDLLEKVGLQPKLLGELTSETSRILLERSVSGIDGWPAMRLAIQSDPQLIRRIAPDVFEPLALNAPEKSLGVAREAISLFSAEVSAISNGNFDAELVKIASHDLSTLGRGWFETLLEDVGSEQSSCIAARGAAILVDLQPIIAEKWLAIALKISREAWAKSSSGTQS